MNEENTKPRARGQYYVCKIITGFERKRDLVKWIDEEDISNEDHAIVYGNKKKITRQSVPVVDVK